MNNRTALIHRIRQRVADGEAKADIYAEYRGTDDAKLAARNLALCVSPVLRKKYRALNTLLLVLLAALTVVKSYVIVLCSRNMDFGMLVGAIIFGVLINLCFIYGVFRFNAIAYLLVFAFGLNGIGNLIESLRHAVLVPDVVSLVLVVACMVLSLILYRLTLPSISWLFRLKRDATGEPIFD